MQFPYSISDFYDIITEKYFYIDRTDRIPLIETTGKHLLFLRPRRFGKSLLLSMLKNYYDIAKADEFEQLFGNLAIGSNPTDRHNQYFVLEWDFSAVNPMGEAPEIQARLYHYINGTTAIPGLVESNFNTSKYGKKLYCFSNMIRNNECENDFRMRYRVKKSFIGTSFTKLNAVLPLLLFTEISSFIFENFFENHSK